MLIEDNNIAIIEGYNNWDLLKYKNVHNKVIQIINVAYIASHEGYPIFINAETIFLSRCDKNFVFYWLNKNIFPKVKNIYLFSHPCDPEVFYRFEDVIIYLEDYFWNIYKNLWAYDVPSIISIKEDELFNILKSYNQELIITSDQNK